MTVWMNEKNVELNGYAYHNDYPTEARINGITQKIQPVDGSYLNGYKLQETK